MSKRSDQAKVVFILEMIARIDMIVERHGGIIEALEDKEGELALYMAVSQIGETIRKLSDAKIKELSLEEERRYAYQTRNYIMHDYEGVDKYILEEVIRTHMPILRSKLTRRSL